jgi:hypothetical protein
MVQYFAGIVITMIEQVLPIRGPSLKYQPAVNIPVLCEWMGRLCAGARTTCSRLNLCQQGYFVKYLPEVNIAAPCGLIARWYAGGVTLLKKKAMSKSPQAIIIPVAYEQMGRFPVGAITSTAKRPPPCREPFLK